MKHKIWFSSLGLVIFLLSACTLTFFSAQKTPTWPASDLSPLNTVSLTQTVMQGDTETPAPNPTLISINTLDAESIPKTIQPFLQDPMNCLTPCFWGMIPGTSIDEVKAFFNRLGFQHREGIDPYSGKEYYTVGYEDNIGLDTSIIFYASGNQVESIEISPDVSSQTKMIPRQWISYSPETLIKKFGPPTRVQFAVNWGPNFVIVMVMYFDDIDLIAEYSGYNMLPERPRSPELCPLTAPFDHIRFWMGSNPPNPPSFETVSLEKATSLTVDQFSELLLGDPQQACFILNGEAFGPW